MFLFRSMKKFWVRKNLSKIQYNPYLFIFSSFCALFSATSFFLIHLNKKQVGGRHISTPFPQLNQLSGEEKAQAKKKTRLLGREIYFNQRQTDTVLELKKKQKLFT